MKFSIRTTQFLTAGILLALCLLSQYFLLVQSLLHGVINIFAGGRSGVKVLLFLLFAAGLFLVQSPWLIKQANLIRLNYRQLLGWIGLIFLYNLFLSFWFHYKYGFGISDFIITFNNSEISSTKLLHTHVAKGAMGILSQAFGIGKNEGVDAGLVFVGLIPDALLWLTLLMLIITIFIIVVYFLKSVDTNRKFWWLYTLLFAAASFSIMKNFIDGGLFNRETLPAISALMLIALPQKKRIWALFPLTIFLIVMPLSFFSGMIVAEELGYIIFTATAFLCMSTAIWYIYEENKIDKLGVLLSVFAAVFFLHPLFGSYQTYSSLQKPLPVDGSIVGFYSQKESHKTDEPIETIGQLHLNKVGQEFNSKQALLNEYGLLDNLDPVMSPWHNCIPSGADVIYEFELKTFEKADTSLTQYQLGNVVQMTEIEGVDHGLYRYHTIIALKPCAPRGLNIAEELLNEKVRQPYFVVNIKNYDAGTN